MEFQCFDWYDSFPVLSGIYAIIFNDGRIYVGQAQNFKARWKRHKTDMNCKRHDNPYLQNVFNKYGKESLSFVILEECELSDLAKNEQKWGDIFQANKYQYGLNSAGYFDHPTRGKRRSEETKLKIALANQSLYESKMREVTIVSPTGEIVHVKGIGKFCRENELAEGCFRLMLNGKQPAYNGWVLYNNGDYKLKAPLKPGDCYDRKARGAKSSELLKGTCQKSEDCIWAFIEFISPEGRIYLTNSTFHLAFQLNLPAYYFNCLLYKGIKKGLFSLDGNRFQLRGWSIYKIHYKEGRAPILNKLKDKRHNKTKWDKLWIEKDDIIYEVDNLAEFAKNKNVSYQGLTGIVYQKEGRKQYKGWVIVDVEYKPEYAHLNNSHS